MMLLKIPLENLGEASSLGHLSHKQDVSMHLQTSESSSTGISAQIETDKCTNILFNVIHFPFLVAFQCYFSFSSCWKVVSKWWWRGGFPGDPEVHCQHRVSFFGSVWQWPQTGQWEILKNWVLISVWSSESNQNQGPHHNLGQIHIFTSDSSKSPVGCTWGQLCIKSRGNKKNVNL